MRAFDAAARQGSFKCAAEELNVTRSAVSRQISSLEDYLEVRLFYRRDGALVLTDLGQTYFTELRRAFDILKAASENIIVHDVGGPLTVSTYPTFAMRWLIPRLSSFHTLYPNIETRIKSSPDPVNFFQYDIDVAIGYAPRAWSGYHCKFLWKDDVFPVCGPTYLRSAPPLRKLADLANHVLIHSTWVPDEWNWWLSAAGVDGVKSELGPKVDTRELAVQAAISGVGVALGHTPIIDEFLAAGRLVAPLGVRLPSWSAYYLVTPETREKSANIAAFCDWIFSECAKDKASARPETSTVRR